MRPKSKLDAKRDEAVLELDTQGRPLHLLPTEARPFVKQSDARTTSERRYAHRYGLRVPLVFCSTDSSLAVGSRAKSINISSRGVCFATSDPLAVGSPVQVLLRMPRRITGALPCDRVFYGRIAHVEWKSVASGSSEVGVEFFYWEPSPTMA